MTCHHICQVLSLLPLLTPAFSSDLGTYGSTFDIQEKDIREVLAEKMQSETGQKLLQDLLQSLKEKSQNPAFKVQKNISNAIENNSFLIDPSITLTTDFKDPHGVVFYKSGTPLNPLHHMTLSKGYVFVDGDNPKHIEFAQNINQTNPSNKPMMIILVKGNPLKMIKDNPNMKVFFDQEGFMCKRFKISKIPATVEQEGLMLRVREHKLETHS